VGPAAGQHDDQCDGRRLVAIDKARKLTLKYKDGQQGGHRAA